MTIDRPSFLEIKGSINNPPPYTYISVRYQTLKNVKISIKISGCDVGRRFVDRERGGERKEKEFLIKGWR